MGAIIKLKFSGIPDVNDFVRFNDSLVGTDIVETFVTNRTNPKEVTIGSTIEETINNFETAFNLDYGSLLIYNIDKTSTSITISFPNGGSGTFDEVISSDVISYNILIGYNAKYEANYTNNSGDQFKILIYLRDYLGTQTKELISAYADLSYKDVDGILEPIRGAQLDININASIERPFDLFLDFKDKDFLAELYRNDTLIFQGFINPEGVTQSFTSKYWVSQLTAVDNLAALKNTELKYDNQLPSEFVLMDLCLKETGLNLPIAFFDDINFRRKNESGVTSFYGKLLANGEDERIVDPLVFKNDNGRFVSCNKVLQDILNKYNAVLVQQTIEHDGGTDLCWVFYRPALFYKSYGITAPQYSIKKITGYTTQTNYKEYASIDVPNIVELGRANPKTFNLGSKDNPVNNSYYKNSNQLIRQSRALQNFRFIQNWIQRDDWLDYDYNRVNIYDSFFTENNYISNQNDLVLLQSTSFLASQVSSFTFIPSVFLATELDETIDLTDNALDIEINGQAVLTNNTGSSIPGRNKSLLCSVYHIVPDGADVGVYVARATYEDDILSYDPGKIESINWIKISSNINDGYIKPDNYEDTLFLFYTNEFFNVETTVDFNLTLPPFVQKGGNLNIFVGQFHETRESGGSVSEKTYQCLISDLSVNVIPPSSLGKGEFHDALNLQPISTKLDEPIEVINADETTNFFRNGLRYLPASNVSLENYDLWTTDYNQFGATRLLEIMSKERIRLFDKSQNIFSGDIGNYVPYFCRIQNQAYSNYFFNFTKWIYRTAENTIEAEMREVGIGNPSVKYENSIIFEDEENRLIE